MPESEEQSNNRPWLYKKGQSGNPGGRPKGSKSMKTWIKEKFERMNDEEREIFLEGINKIDLFKMAEGNPKQDTDITSKGLPIIQLAQEVLNKNDINTEPSDNSEGQA